MRAPVNMQAKILAIVCKMRGRSLDAIALDAYGMRRTRAYWWIFPLPWRETDAAFRARILAAL